MDQNPAIKERFLGEPDWLNLYGLPIRYEEHEVNGNPQGLQMLRAQRTVFVIWNVPAPGTTVGRVNLQNVPDKVKKLSNVIIPDAAKVPVPQHEIAGLPVFALPTPTPVPTPTPTPTPAPAPTPAPTPTNDREALAQLYHATGGPTWRNNTNWLSEAPLEEWHGVSSDGHGGVVNLQLENNRLLGTLPTALGYLGNLRWLNLRGNQLHGSIPPALGHTANLRWLSLSDNQLGGAIPPQIGRLASLTVLDLSQNRLGGTIPPELGALANLQSLNLTWNRIEGRSHPS